MRRSRPSPALGLILVTIAAGCAVPAIHWPQWRGPLGTGVAPAADSPLSWSERSNLRWKVALPGRGHASPVVWSERFFVLTAVPAAAAEADAAGGDGAAGGSPRTSIGTQVNPQRWQASPAVASHPCGWRQLRRPGPSLRAIREAAPLVGRKALGPRVRDQSVNSRAAEV